MVFSYNYLFVTFSLYSVFNEHLPSRFRSQQDIFFNVLGRPLLESRSALAAYPLRESISRNVLRTFWCLVGPSGLEPPTSCLSGTRSNLLSYEPIPVGSHLPTTLVEMMGLEPMTPCLQSRCSPN